jgi:hypothetical protein
MKRALPLAVPAALFIIFACNMPGASSEADAALTLQATEASETPTETPDETTTATVTATSTQTLTPTATSVVVACNQASFVSDVTVPDDTAFTVNDTFTKTWRLKNVGSCTWTSGYDVVFDSGDQMSGPASQQLTGGTVAPNQTIDVSVDLKAPASPGTYKGNWKLREPGGQTFGLSTGPFWVQIKAQPVVVIIIPLWPSYDVGSSGNEVKAAQRLLVYHGENVNIDGTYNALMRPKVKNFQSSEGLTDDGIIGAQTWGKLIVQVKQGSTGQPVRAVQELLSTKFGYAVAVDGIFGPATNNAVKDFQDNHGLDVDGIVGPQTWLRLIAL